MTALAGVALRTARLAVRTVRAGDAPGLLAYAAHNRAHLDRWEPARPPGFETVAYWERYIAITEREQETGERARFIAEYGDGGEFVASINLHGIEHGAFCGAVLGYSVDARYEGRGLGREAVGAVVRYAFDTLALHRIEANYQPVNQRSGKLLRALGFVVEGYSRDYLFLDGAWRDHIRAALTRIA